MAMDLVKLVCSDVGRVLGLLHLLFLIYGGSGFARLFLLYLCAETLVKCVFFASAGPGLLSRGVLSVFTVGFLWALCSWVLYCLYALVLLVFHMTVVVVVISLISFAYLNPEETRRLVSVSVSRILDRLEGYVSLLQGLPSLLSFGRRLVQPLHGALQELWQQVMDSVLAGVTLLTTPTTTPQLHHHHLHHNQQERQRQTEDNPPASSGRPRGTEEVEKCVICQDRPKSVLLLPCRHLCLCAVCKNTMRGQDVIHQCCPLCRTPIHNTIDVFI